MHLTNKDSSLIGEKTKYCTEMMFIGLFLDFSTIIFLIMDTIRMITSWIIMEPTRTPIDPMLMGSIGMLSLEGGFGSIMNDWFCTI